MIVLRFGELYTKSDYVRSQFIHALATNVRKTFPTFSIRLRRWRIEVHCPSRKDKVALAQALRIFGITSASAVRQVRATPQLGGVLRAALAEARAAGLRSGKTFAVRAKRLEKEFPKDSIQINREVGEFLRKKTGASVDLSSPDIEVNVEVLKGRAYVFSAALQGPGGMPLGTAGRMLLLLEGANTPLAGWMLLKRGAKLVCAFKRKGQKKLARPLAPWSVPAPVLFFPRPEEEVIRWKKCLGVVTSTRSPREFARLCKRFEVPVYAPLIGLSDRRLRELRQKVLK